MSTPVRDGDKITVVDRVTPWPFTPVFHATVLGPTFYDNNRSFRWYVPFGDAHGWTADDEEGVVWIRGHHNANSTEAKALRAAYALRAPRIPYDVESFEVGESFEVSVTISAVGDAQLTLRPNASGEDR